MKASLLFNVAISIIFSLFFCISYGQDTPKESNFWEEVSFGGNIGANFSTRFTNVLIAPQAIYRVNDYVGLGLGLNYSYVRRNFDDGNDFKSNLAGGSLIGLFQPVEQLQLSADFEYLHVNQNFDNSQLDRQYWVPALFLGAGYRQGNFVIGARYDVLFNENKSVYQNGIQPFVRVLF